MLRSSAARSTLGFEADPLALFHHYLSLCSVNTETDPSPSLSSPKSRRSTFVVWSRTTPPSAGRQSSTISSSLSPTPSPPPPIDSKQPRHSTNSSRTPSVQRPLTHRKSKPGLNISFSPPSLDKSNLSPRRRRPTTNRRTSTSGGWHSRHCTRSFKVLGTRWRRVGNECSRV